MNAYTPAEIEAKWQSVWAQDERYRARTGADQPKTYVSCMFPYPSGAGMHSGHAFEHAIVDAIARFQRAHGHMVLNPMGWDAFGLPAENYAIKTGTAPADSTRQNIANFTTQLRRMGVSVDWSRQINTSDPEYYRWTQWIFLQLFKRGLAYQKDSLQWWCPVDKTVLANEQVINGRCWRCDNPVEKRAMRQWFFRITAYADRLLEQIPALDWPDKIKTAQTNWIGRSQGAEVDFVVDGRPDQTITVFTTRPDTLFGVTFVVLAPEHPLARRLAHGGQAEAVASYIDTALKRSDVERQADAVHKTGVATGAYARNPATGQLIPIWVADYVLGGYGTGAVMAVPGHDERDHAFAQAFDLPIVTVVDRPETNPDPGPYTGEGPLINSGAFDGMSSDQAREAVVAWLEEQGQGKTAVSYKMRDWLISRQRYWGAPIPIIHCPQHGAVPVPEDQLPVRLPVVDDYTPHGDGRSVLERATDWVQTTCPTCGGPARRETDTMDGYACSSWYLLRYTDPHNRDQAWGQDATDYWLPVDFYVGGDHAVAHLLYVRFWSHVLHDMGLVPTAEPIKKLVYHGYINAEDGTKMSKSKGNVVDPLEVIEAGYGADALRTFLLFLGPIDLDANWSPRGIAGVYRFLNRVWTLVQEYQQATGPANHQHDEAIARLMARLTRKVTQDYRRLSFNTAIAAMMEATNQLYKYKVAGFSPAWQAACVSLVQLLAPIAPHMTAELWQMLGHDELLDTAPWPTWDDDLTQEATVTVAVQINGKLRATIQVSPQADQAHVEAAAQAQPNVARYLAGATVRKYIYVPGRLLNIVL